MFHLRPVPHNLSQQQFEQMERDRRLAELKPFLEPGWQLDRLKAEIVEVSTVLGCFQRGQELLLRCKRDGCRRRVDVDLRGALQAGLGDLPAKDLLQLLRCRHWSGCALEEYSAIYPGGVPLVGYLAHADVLIAIACAHCGARTLLPPREVIRRLKAVGRGNGNTGVIALAQAVRGPCRKCRTTQFTTEVVWARGDGCPEQKTETP